MTARRRSALALVVFVLTPCVSFCAEQWTEIRSPNFDIITDAGEKRGREAALRFEQVRAAFGEIFLKVKLDTPVPLQIIAFDSNDQLRHFAPLWRGKPVDLAGFYVGGEDRQFIALDSSSTYGWEIAAHEYTHLLIHSALGEIPVWLDEGLADYFSTVKLDRGHLTYGALPSSGFYIRASGRSIKLQRLLTIDHNSPEYNEGSRRRSSFYGESWLLVHYLISKEKYNQIGSYLNFVLDDHLPVGEAVERAFGMTIPRLDAELDGYLRGLSRVMIFHGPGQQVPSGNEFTARKLSRDDGDAILADLHGHEIDYLASALDEFRAILQRSPNNVIAHRGAAYALLRHGDYAEAEGHLKAAVSSGAADARTHYLYALLLTRKGSKTDGDTIMLSNTADIDVAALKKQAEAAILLDPNFADAYNLLAYAQARENDFQGAVASETKALTLDKYKRAYLLNLAQYEAGARNFDYAERLLKALMTSKDEGLVKNARNLVQMIQTQRNFEEAAHNAPAASPPMQSFEPSSVTASGKSSPPPPAATIQFAKGKIVKVDCSTPPGATVALMVEKKLWSMTTPDRDKLILIGADSFSCEWHNRNVAVNFREMGNNVGEIVSLELQ